MKNESVFVGLDIGTTKVCTVVGFLNSEGGLELVGVGNHPSHGLKKGTVVNINQTIDSIRASVEEAKLTSGIEITQATIGIAGAHIYSFNSDGVVAVKGQAIEKSDVERVIESAKAVVIPPDRKILHVIPREYIVDNVKGIKNPIGMRGVRLETKVHIVSGAISAIENLISCVEGAGIKVENIVLQPMASSEAVLGREEKDIGVALVDIGGGTTDLAIWKGETLVHSQIIPVGGNHFTNDLAMGLNCTYSEAERIKMNHGQVLLEKIDQMETLVIQGHREGRPREVYLRVVSKILGARAEELFEIIRNIFEEKELNSELTGGIILTGGGARIDGLIELGEYLLKRPTKIGFPVSLGGMSPVMRDPKYATAVGLLLESKRFARQQLKIHQAEDVPVDLITRLGQSLKSVFKDIF